MDPQVRKLRQSIFTYTLDRCRLPTIKELASANSLTEDDVFEGLHTLEDGRHLTLYDEKVHSPTPIAMVHPFSHLPTPYIVKENEGNRWWFANCAWCALGLAAMLQPRATVIETRSGAMHQEMKLATFNGELLGTKKLPNACVHFSVPLSKWWDDVRFACGTILLFESPAQASEWTEAQGFFDGECVDLKTMWELAKFWYQDKASYDYERKSKEELNEAFARFGMTSEFWAV